MASRRTALITGAGRNIGRACVLGLAEDGFDVVLNGSSDRAACEKVAKEAGTLGAKTLVVMGDVGKPRTARRIADAALEQFGAVDVLLNNAALRPNKPFLEMSEAKVASRHLGRPRCLGVAVARLLARHAGEGLGPHSQFHRHQRHPWTCRPHAGVGRQARRVGPHQGAGHGVRAEEHHRKRHLARADRAGRRGEERLRPGPRADAWPRVPLGRMGTPAEVAAAARLLVSEAGAYINGQMIQVNGGARDLSKIAARGGGATIRYRLITVE